LEKNVPAQIKIKYVDFGAEKLMAAEKDGRKIGVEVKSFTKNEGQYNA